MYRMVLGNPIEKQHQVHGLVSVLSPVDEIFLLFANRGGMLACFLGVSYFLKGTNPNCVSPAHLLSSNYASKVSFPNIIHHLER